MVKVPDYPFKFYFIGFWGFIFLVGKISDSIC